MAAVEGLLTGDLGRLVEWVVALVGAGVLTAYLSIMRHRTMTRVRMDGRFPYGHRGHAARHRLSGESCQQALRA